MNHLFNKWSVPCSLRQVPGNKEKLFVFVRPRNASSWTSAGQTLDLATWFTWHDTVPLHCTSTALCQADGLGNGCRTWRQATHCCAMMQMKTDLVTMSDVKLSFANTTFESRQIQNKIKMCHLLTQACHVSLAVEESCFFNLCMVWILSMNRCHCRTQEVSLWNMLWLQWWFMIV